MVFININRATKGIGIANYKFNKFDIIDIANLGSITISSQFLFNIAKSNIWHSQKNLI